MEAKLNSGAIFRNEKKSENAPDYKGKINVDGTEKDIALWVRKSEAGRSYFSVKISDPYRKPEPVPDAERQADIEATDDLPF